MPDNLQIIKRILEEHQTIKGHVKLVGDAVSDQEALRSLEGSRADLIPGRLGALPEIQKTLQRALLPLDEGLRNHFAFEEENLPPILGEILMKSLLLEHQEIKASLDHIKSTLSRIKPENLSRDELLTKEAQMQEMVNKICQLVGDHAAKEEMILEMAQRALEEKS